jgi:predicted Rossmann fold flavoprotein
VDKLFLNHKQSVCGFFNVFRLKKKKHGIIIAVVMMRKYDIAIIGAGAAGISCALACKQKNPNKTIIILEQNDRIGKKILKTGNGKCNLGNVHLHETSYYNWNYIQNKMKQFDVIKYFKKMGIMTKQDEQGRLYPYSETAASIVDILRYELERREIIVQCSFMVTNIIKDKNFIIQGMQDSIEAEKIVVATGSLAQEKTNGYQLLERLGHHITPLSPRLVPIKVEEKVKPLQGIRVKCLAKANGFQEYGEILFKESGLSGILALNLSRHVNKKDEIILDFAPEKSFLELKEYIKGLENRDLSMMLRGLLPKMLILDILKKADTIETIANTIKNYRLTVKDLYGYEFAQITRGGVDMAEIKEDFASKIIKNLYIVGEVLDVDGECGGYNLMFAWMSGSIVGENI